MDGTIEDLLSVWLVELNKMAAVPKKREEIRDWDLNIAFPELTDERIVGILKDDEIWSKVKPIEDAPETLKYFMDQGHEVYIVTSTPYYSVKPKMENLLFKYFPFLDWDHVIIAKRKQLLKGDILIDDAPHNLTGGEYQSILFDATYNEDFPAEENGMIRAKGWKNVKEIVDKMAQETV